MKRYLLLILAILTVCVANASARDSSQVSWKIVAVPAGAGLYNIQFQMQLARGWHMWTLHPGADKSLIPPSFHIDPATATVVGETSEQGIATDMQFPGINGYTRFYNNEAMFIRQVKAPKGRTVKGSYTYQLCNNSICLPPKTVSFSVKLP